MDQAERATQPLNYGIATRYIGTSSLDTRNDLVPIYCLPPEILSLIFAELVLMHPPDYHYSLPKGLDLGWINVTHVSRRWQEIALQHPQLWTAISTVPGKQWMQEMLVRSKVLPLDMQLFVQDEEEASISSKHMSRTIRLHLRVEDIIDFNMQDNLLMQPVPMLETCMLDLISQDDADIPVSLFANYAPRLRALTLDVWMMRWTCPVFAGLVELSVILPGVEDMDNPWEERQDEPYCTEFFQALSQMAKLETLNLVNCLTKSLEALTAETPSVHVPDIANLTSLKMLNVTGTPLGAASLASCICLPSTCKVAVIFELDMVDIRNDADAVLFLLPHLVGFLSQPVQRLALHGTKPGNDYKLSLWTHTNPWPGKPLFLPEATRSHHVKDSSSKPNIRIIASVSPLYSVPPSLASNMVAMPNALSLACFVQVPLQGIQVVDIADRVLTWNWTK